MQQSVYRFEVRGRVQGVAFRAHVRAAARRLGVSGWVANQPDGSVRGLACGTDAALSELRGAVQAGPPAVLVDAMVWEPAIDAPPSSEGFAIRQDAAR